jgi:hypothetical protein
MKTSLIHSLVFILALALPLSSLIAQGKVYLVLGSDTALWDGMDVNKYYCTYALSLFDDPGMNAHKVMDPAFRAQFKDSYGQSMKMTWWMMAGNIFRFATNRNIPVPNIMTLYLMKKYYGVNAKALGDEITMHYHTFVWTDYNKDGSYYWNQAKNFTESKDDFKVTLAQFLLEENTFPVSFRSGWHYMDNEWQNYLDRFVPYSLHNDYPAVRNSIIEPIDNVYDWSKASKEFVPFHPSLTNYQLPGDAKGWNTRSIYMASISQAQMDDIFLKAKNGIDQVPCIWAHLPETDFPQNMKRVDSLAHISAAKYPTVKFSYCTAVEAMQKWRKGNDTTAPSVTFEEVISGDKVRFSIHTDENIFQAEPFVALKDVYEEYSVLPCTKTAENQWMTTDLVPRASIAKVGVMVTDTMGNLSTKFLKYYPDDLYLDNLDDAYHEVNGAWTTSATRSWGTNSRQCVLAAGDSAKVNWTPLLQDSGLYNISMQIPKLSNGATNLLFRIYNGAQMTDTARITAPFAEGDWTYVTTSRLAANATIQMMADGNDQPGKTVAADAIKLSALVKDRWIYTRTGYVQMGPVSEEDTVHYSLKIENHGVKDLTLSEITVRNKNLSVGVILPLVIPGMKGSTIPLSFFATDTGEVRDTLIIMSDDPRTPVYLIPVSITVQPYFAMVDNEDSLSYTEKGVWAKSNAQAWGASSRYAASGMGASASFKRMLKKKGTYEVFEIVPTTVNAIVNALYVISAGGDSLWSVILDQNKGSGSWTSLGRHAFPANVQIQVQVIDNSSPASGRVLRADAIKFQLVPMISVADNSSTGMIKDFILSQNFPNPFNPSTVISYQLAVNSHVTLTVFDMLGREVATLANEQRSAGSYSAQWNAPGIASGVYLVRMEARPTNSGEGGNHPSGLGQSFSATKKIVLLK